jgi:hypothetical protein
MLAKEKMRSHTRVRGMVVGWTVVRPTVVGGSTERGFARRRWTRRPGNTNISRLKLIREP